MATEVVVNTGVPGLPASETISLGDVIVPVLYGSVLGWGLADVNDVDVWYVACADAVAGERLEGRRVPVMKVKVRDTTGDGLAIGTALYIDEVLDDGALTETAVASTAPKAILAEAVPDGEANDAGVYKVVLGARA